MQTGSVQRKTEGRWWSGDQGTSQLCPGSGYSDVGGSLVQFSRKIRLRDSAALRAVLLVPTSSCPVPPTFDTGEEASRYIEVLPRSLKMGNEIEKRKASTSWGGEGDAQPLITTG